ncbi:hypothetical protein [Kribbella jejuensis]|uniref:Uncharacterized protein n=1 Tax=Kribbella jejuensis TaxID=236068 RepID=A0A542E8S5_9ACTN|nr:hypothetical protein [Kribbella jejuensis]TQJ11738.1 hypothetical protein FB475_4660 [Kribbella jejuensis]
MPSALAAASSVLGRPDLLGPAIGDTVGFTPLLLASGGPDNGWLPVPIDRSQIAYGVDARLQALVAVGQHHLAAFAAAWYFGSNRAGQPMYDPTTGRTYDGISGDGTINRNSGAESSIHGQLSMLALDAHPEIARLSGTPTYDGLQIVEAETATGGEVVTPPSAWTGESQWSNGSYLSLDGTAAWTVPAATQPRLVLPVVNVLETSSRTLWSLGPLDYQGGPQGISAAPGALLPLTLPKPLPARATTITAAGTAQIDALLLLPLLSSLKIGNATLLVNLDTHPRPVAGKNAWNYNSSGHLVTQGKPIVQPGGFTVLLD